MFEERQRFALPIEVRGVPGTSPIDTTGVFDATLKTILPDLTDRELEKINGHFFELLDKIAQKSGHLPKDVIPTRGKGEMTHVLNGRLLRKDGIWIGLHFATDPLTSPLEIISISRGTPDQLQSMIGSMKAIGRRIEIRHAKSRGQDPVPKFHLH